MAFHISGFDFGCRDGQNRLLANKCYVIRKSLYIVEPSRAETVIPRRFFATIDDNRLKDCVL